MLLTSASKVIIKKKFKEKNMIKIIHTNVGTINKLDLFNDTLNILKQL